jgi:orotidine-5'-phosphate decarboxylase
MPSAATKSYADRAVSFSNPTAKAILETMERKKSNLAVSVDVTKPADLLAIIEAVAPYVCMIKAIPSPSHPASRFLTTAA